MEATEVVNSPVDEEKAEESNIMLANSNKFLNVAKTYEVDSIQKLETADEFCARALKYKQEAVAFYKPQKKFFDDKKALVLKEEKSVLAPLDEGRELLKNKIQKFQKLLKQKEAEEAAKAAEEHRKQQEALKKAEEDRRIAQAETLEKQGKADEAAKILDAPYQSDTTAPPPTMKKAAPKIKTKIVEAWTYEVLDESLVPREYLMLDEKKINMECRNHKGKTKIPGIRAYDKNAV